MAFSWHCLCPLIFISFRRPFKISPSFWMFTLNPSFNLKLIIMIVLRNFFSIWNAFCLYSYHLSNIEGFFFNTISYYEGMPRIYFSFYKSILSYIKFLFYQNSSYYKSVSSGLPPCSSYHSVLILNSFCIYVFPI